MKAKEYKIKTIKDIQKVVTKDNLDNFMIDLKTFLNMSIDFDDLVDLLGAERNTAEFIWIDDGKNDLKKITIELAKPKRHKI